MSVFSRLRNSISRTGRSINKFTREVQPHIKAINRYEVTRKEIASKMKILDRDSINLQSGNIELDINQTLRDFKRKGLSRKEGLNRLNSILDKAKKSAREAKRLSGEDARTNIAVKELIELRISEKYKAMSNSAGKKGHVKNEADFWYRTVNMAVKTLGANNKLLLRKLNAGLKKEGYPTMTGAQRAMLLL